MIGIENILAKKYAQAFLNRYGDSFLLHDYDTLKNTQDFFKKHASTFFLFTIPTLAPAKKYTLLLELLEQLHLPKALIPLVKLLVEHQRVLLLPLVLHAIIKLYEERNKIAPFIISSAQTLEKNELDILKNFLEKKTRYHILYTFLQNKKLIAGIRMHSDFFLWEYSVAKQLREVSKTLQ